MSRRCEPGCTCGRHRPPRICAHCGGEFRPRWGAKHRYCSRQCSDEARLTPFEDGFTQGGPDECWEWEGTRFVEKGYGRWRGRRAHVVAWEQEHGTPVPEGLLVLHRCDNPPCVNPAHLYAGTQSENMFDRSRRTSGWRGTGINTAKLTEAQVYEIRARRDAGTESLHAIAADYPVSSRMVGLIARREAWRWLPER